MYSYEETAAARHLSILVFRHAGSHLVKPFTSRLSGLPLVDLYKLPIIDHRPNGPVMISFRDPRNIFVSQLRWGWRRRGKMKQPGSARTDAALAALIAPENFSDSRGRPGDSPVAIMAAFVRYWKDYPGSARLDFEDLTGPDRHGHAAQFAARLGKSADTAIALLDQVSGIGQTFTGSHSDYRDWFGPESWAAWRKTGGPALAELMGYCDEK